MFGIRGHKTFKLDYISYIKNKCRDLTGIFLFLSKCMLLFLCQFWLNQPKKIYCCLTLSGPTEMENVCHLYCVRTEEWVKSLFIFWIFYVPCSIFLTFHWGFLKVKNSMFRPVWSEHWGRVFDGLYVTRVASDMRYNCFLQVLVWCFIRFSLM